jgi:hypothetical protein
MKIYKVLTILFLLPMGQAMGAAALDSEDEGDPWVERMMTRYGEDVRVRGVLEDMKPFERTWLEEKASIYGADQNRNRWKSFVDLMDTPQGPKWFDRMVDNLSTQERPCSDVNLEALLTIAPNARFWVSNMTGQLMTLDFRGDLGNWVSLLKELSAPYVDKYGPQSRQRVGWRLDKIFQKFRDSLEAEIPESLTKDYFDELLRGRAAGMVSESEPETGSETEN